MARNIAALARMFSRLWLMRRAQEGNGCAVKKASISVALSAVQKREMLETIMAAISEGEALEYMVLINSKFCIQRNAKHIKQSQLLTSE